MEEKEKEIRKRVRSIIGKTTVSKTVVPCSNQGEPAIRGRKWWEFLKKEEEPIDWDELVRKAREELWDDREH